MATRDSHTKRNASQYSQRRSKQIPCTSRTRARADTHTHSHTHARTHTHLLQITNILSRKKTIELPMHVMYAETTRQANYPQRPTTWKHATHSHLNSHIMSKDRDPRNTYAHTHPSKDTLAKHTKETTEIYHLHPGKTETQM